MYIFQNSNIHHPKVLQLGLLGEKIQIISACSTRCSVITETGKMATWVDDLLSAASSKLENPAQSYTEFQIDKVAALYTCPLYTVARLESGALYWWLVYKLFYNTFFVL